MKKPRLEIQKVLVLSTGHLRWPNAKAMDQDDHDLEWAYDRIAYGYMVYAGEECEEEEKYPDDILAAVKLARKNGCSWIRFDQDGPLVDCLQKFDW